MNIETKFNLGDKFSITEEYLKCMNVKKEDVFKVDGIYFDEYGVWYEYHKHPKKDNRKFNKNKANDRVAEFIMVKA